VGWGGGLEILASCVVKTNPVIIPLMLPLIEHITSRVMTGCGRLPLIKESFAHLTLRV
jgi:hypothetical protein